MGTPNGYYIIKLEEKYRKDLYPGGKEGRNQGDPGQEEAGREVGRGRRGMEENI